ncbi:uncharacterized protein si:dkey-91i10.2 [Melanotaenia boesemani]|uniref:uncharacterized protein si:dkey-91i10.2 n=1 Tax=Melanotaenia boesemani TaxID=1250792 RepID=UPI001C04F94C|nr:uncharacterized protein si:dkey-91i10.2 [Melanotaenia boesemani]XP_041857801.1 uncharacterized protein si:dkey-91i10.2 [Melanotaenia boesemani]XP_041857802.1 uncharacterized protein si:dkey-91i10.2 [Melanotaenia boesemani]
MPDVKPPPSCDYSSASSAALSAGSPAGCNSPFDLVIDMEPCIANLPLSPDPLSSFPRHRLSVPHYPGIPGPPYPLMARCNSSTLLTNLGLRYCSSRQGPLGTEPGQGLAPGSFIHTGNNSSRPYRSMENLNWNSMTDSGLCTFSDAPCRSVDSEFILRYTSSSHWYDGPPDGSVLGAHGLVPNPESLAFYPRHGPPRKDLPLFPQLLFPGGVDEWDARKGLREKLRLHIAKSSVEPVRPLPLRPQMAPNVTPAEQEAVHLRSSTSIGSRPLCTMRTSPEEIKQEVLRRLQLRRQNSSPNLAVHNSPSSPKAVKTSYTTDNIAGNRSGTDSACERRRPPVGRIHIPTFEEFKRMRQREGMLSSDSTAGSVVSVKHDLPQDNRSSDSKIITSDQSDSQLGSSGEKRENPEEVASDKGLQTITSSDQLAFITVTNNYTTATTLSSSSVTSTYSPIRTGPSPRSPLQPQVSSTQDKATVVGGDGSGRRRRSSLEPAGSVPLPPGKKNWEHPSSCCPALLLEGTDLSSYGAKIYKMKDGLIGSALDLIKKSCSAEISAEAPVRLSGDRDGGCDITTSSTDCQPSAVAMATSATACRAEAGNEAPAGEGGGGSEEAGECHTSLGCRRSSSDAAYEPAKTVRAQRECRLRPHYSDPMPADASKRKQLEMKIAAAARLHSHRRDRDRDRDSAPAALRGHSEPPGEERQSILGVTRSGQHRWSTISSLSADSGVVGLSDEREEEDSEPRRHRRTRGAEVERVDSGIGPGLSRTWKRPSTSLRVWEAQRPCPDCGLRDGACKERGERMCERCSKLRTERKEAILEFLNTESSYGEDLRIIKDEFYSPMQSAGLLTAEQLTVVFSNVQELIDVNDRFTEHLQDSIDQAFDQGDDDLLTVYIGEIFLEFVNMLPAFQTYCLQQSTSVNMLNMLEKEKELLRIFLDVSQNDNTALRRMNLRSFLMAPLQRVTKYPLLLSRIIKVTPECHPDYARLREAKSRVESHLEHINMKTKQEGNGVTWSLRSFRRDSRKNREVINIEMREVSMKTVGWARENTRFVMEGPLQLSQPADGQWVKKGSKALKFQNVQSLLMVRTQRVGEASCQGSDLGARGDQGEGVGESIRDGVLVLIKDKSSGKFTVLREPIRLGNCVVSTDPDSEDTFEVLDIRRESFVFRASDKSRTQQWFHQIKRYARDLGTWRKRRNALPNIMINTNQTRS